MVENCINDARRLLLFSQCLFICIINYNFLEKVCTNNPQKTKKKVPYRNPLFSLDGGIYVTRYFGT